MKSINSILVCGLVFAILGIFELVYPKSAYASEQTVAFSQESVSGTITYRERIALPSGAVVKVKLLDVSLQDAPAKELSSQIITTRGEQVPILFNMSYDPSEIKSNHYYAVRAEIFIDDKLAFTTTQRYAVITMGNAKTVDLVLQKVKNISRENELTGSKWLLEDLAGKGVLDRLQTTVEFGEDNQLGGNGGCNRYNASYEIKESSFRVNSIATTFKMCSPAVMNQESQFLKALEKAQSIRLEGPYLLIDCEGYDKPLKFTRY